MTTRIEEKHFPVSISGENTSVRQDERSSLSLAEKAKKNFSCFRKKYSSDFIEKCKALQCSMSVGYPAKNLLTTFLKNKSIKKGNKI